MPSESSEFDKKQNGNAHDDDSKARTRVSRACTRCRARKDRCDGQRPTCSACRNAQATCCYEPATKKRGLPEGYVRGLEKLLALLIGKIDGLENTASQLMHEHRVELLKIWNHVSIGEELHTTWKESKIIHELESLLGGLDQNVTTGQKRKRERDDELDDAEEEIDVTFHTRSQYQISRTDHDAQTESGLHPWPSRPAPDVELPANAIELVDHYFAHTHCWFPIVDRPQVLRACYELSRGKAQHNNDKSITSLLWVIFAFTTRHLQHSDRSIDPRDTNENASVDEHYRAVAYANIPSDPQSLTRTHAQSFLILALLEIGLDKWKSAWSLVGQAVRIILCEGSEKNNMRRNDTALFQGCAVLDIAIASHLGVVPHLRRTDIETRTLMSEDGYEEWEPWTAPGLDQTRNREPSFATSCFNRLTEVFLINADLLALLSQPEKVDRTFVQSLLGRLHQLQTTVPGTMPPSLQSPPHHIYLQLCHVSIQMRLVDLPVDTGAGGVERARLACNVLGLLELCKNAKVVGLHHVPPFLVDCIELASKMARSSSSAFGAASGLPSYHEFNRTASELISSMADTWPVYSNVSGHHSNALQPSLHVATPPSRPNTGVSPNPLSSPTTSELTAQKQLRGSVTTSQRQNSTPMTSHPTFSSENVSLPDLNNWQHPGPGHNPFSLPNNNIMQFGGGPVGSNGDPNIHSIGSIAGLEMAGSTPTAPLGLTIPEPSPSFQGDEIDAIFHEMAHLDTNEWTSERALGLRDFGFSDDLTFQAFCNDPERLIAPVDGLQAALSSNSHTWTFTDPNQNLT